MSKILTFHEHKQPCFHFSDNPMDLWIVNLTWEIGEFSPPTSELTCSKLQHINNFIHRPKGSIAEEFALPQLSTDTSEWWCTFFIHTLLTAPQPTHFDIVTVCTYRQLQSERFSMFIQAVKFFPLCLHFPTVLCSLSSWISWMKQHTVHTVFYTCGTHTHGYN